MSGLLVKSTAFMKDNLETFNEEGITVPVILGGAALTPKFVHQDCQNTYNGKVVYGKDAFADLHFMDKLMPAKEAGNWDDLKGFLDEESEGAREQESEKVENQQSAEGGKRGNHPFTPHPSPLTLSTPAAPTPVRSHHSPPPLPPSGAPACSIRKIFPWRRCFWYLDLQALFVGQWQFPQAQGPVAGRVRCLPQRNGASNSGQLESPDQGRKICSIPKSCMAISPAWPKETPYTFTIPQW